MIANIWIGLKIIIVTILIILNTFQRYCFYRSNKYTIENFTNICNLFIFAHFIAYLQSLSEAEVKFKVVMVILESSQLMIRWNFNI